MNALSRDRQAVVLDTNLWSHGRLDIGAVADLATRLRAYDVEVWIPRQVVLEWARHSSDDAELAAPAWNRLRRGGWPRPVVVLGVAIAAALIGGSARSTGYSLVNACDDALNSRFVQAQ
ncbi:hypothetical protein [Nocardia sp. NPDC004711]